MAIYSSLVWRRRGGFKATSKTFFDLAHGADKDYRNYLPDAAFQPMSQTNGPFAHGILDDKLLFERLLRSYVPVPEALALIERGEVFATPASATIRDAESLLEYASEQPLILKPALGAKGKGVFSLRHEAGGFYLDSAATSLKAVLSYLAGLDNYLVTPWVQPAPYAAAVFPQAGNTIRVITLRDPGDGHRPFIATAFHKFGTKVSAPTDNWSRGGLIAPLDVATGRLSAGLEELSQTQGRPVTHATHPETGARIEGLQIPRWQAVQEQLLGMLEQFPFFRYVGWDVLMTETGFSVLEGNAAPAIVSLQLTRPLLDDLRVRRFVAHHGVKAPGLP